MARVDAALLWAPSREAVERATLTRYMRWLEAERGLVFDDYAALWNWSVDDLDAFWASLWDFFDVRSAQPFTSVLGRREMPGAQWFPGVELSYCEHVFRERVNDDVAIVAASELRPDTEVTWG